MIPVKTHRTGPAHTIRDIAMISPRRAIVHNHLIATSETPLRVKFYVRTLKSTGNETDGAFFHVGNIHITVANTTHKVHTCI